MQLDRTKSGLFVSILSRQLFLQLSLTWVAMEIEGKKP